MQFLLKACASRGCTLLCVYEPERRMEKMLGMAGFKPDAVRDIITEQMVWSFQRMFRIDCRGKPEEEKVKDFLYGTQHINTYGGILENSL